MKKILSILLALILALSCCFMAVSAATDDSKTLYWSYDEYELGGQLSVSSPVTFESAEAGVTYSCFKITAADAGVYKISTAFTGDAMLDDLAVSEYMKNNQLAVIRDCFFEEEEETMYVSMAAGEEAYCFIDTEGGGEVTLTLEYVGGIKEITYASPVIPGWNSFVYKYEDGSAESEYYASCKVTFDSGDIATIQQEETIDGNITELSSVTAELEIFDETYTVEIPVIYIENIITSITLPDDFTPYVFYSYEGTCYLDCPDYVTVNFSDGTSVQAAIGDTITLPGVEGDGFEIYQEGNSYGTYSVCVANYVENFDAEVEKSGFRSIIRSFFSDIFSEIATALGWIKTDINPDGSYFSELMSDFDCLFRAIPDEIGYLISYLK